MMAKILETEEKTINLIGNGTKIKGDISSTGDIRIDGSLTGNLKTKGKVVIGNTGIISGELSCKNSDIEGKVEGKLIIEELLSLKSNSIINGDIVVKRLSIEPGAKFTGNCDMSSQIPTENVTRPEEEQKKVK